MEAKLAITPYLGIIMRASQPSSSMAWGKDAMKSARELTLTNGEISPDT